MTAAPRTIGIRVLAALVAILTAFVLVGGATASPAAAQESGIGPPPYCYQMDMNDGLVAYTFVTHQYGTNYYRADLIHGDGSANVSCLDPGSYALGELNEYGECIIGGVVAVAMVWVPGFGWVNSVRVFAGGCVATFL